MNSILIATVSGIVALLLWGVSDWFASKSSRKFMSRDVNLAMQAMGAIIMLAVLLISGKGLPSLHDTFILIVASFIFTIAYLCFIRGLAIGEVGIVVPLSNIYPIVTLVLTAVLLTITFTSLQIVAMFVVVGGAVLLGTEEINLRKLHKNFSKEAILALSAALLWGTGFYIVNTVINDYSWQSILSVTSLSMFVYTLIFVLVKNKQSALGSIKNIVKNKTGMIAGACLTFGSIGFYIGATKSGSVLIPAVIASGAPLVTSILAAILDKERLLWTKRLGAILVVFGIIILNF